MGFRGEGVSGGGLEVEGFKAWRPVCNLFVFKG